MKEALKRLVRGGVAIGVAVATQYVSGNSDPIILGIAPILNSIGKYIRTKYAGAWWLPV